MSINGINQSDLKRMNLGLLLRLIHQDGGITRASLAKITGLTVAAVAKLVDELLVEDLIVEVEPSVQKRGRPASGLAFRYETHLVLAVKLSRRYVRWGVFDFSGSADAQYLHEDEIPEDMQSDELLKLIVLGIQKAIKKYRNLRVVGIAVPGPFDVDKIKINVVTEMTNLTGLDLSKLSNEQSDLPIFFIHDANAGAMSEWINLDPKIKNETTLAYYLVGEGVGVGVVEKGRIIQGRRGMAAELGHVSIDPDGGLCGCGNRGCLEMYCSSISVERRVERERKRDPRSELNNLVKPNIREILNLAARGDELAARLVGEAAHAIALGAVNIVNAYDPEIIVIGDKMSQGGQALLDQILPTLKERTSYRIDNITVEMEDTNYDHILHGAASNAIRNCLENPDLLKDRM